MDYLSDDGKHITQMLVDKFSTLLTENEMPVTTFERLNLTEQFQAIESFQRRRRDLKHATLHE